MLPTDVVPEMSDGQFWSLAICVGLCLLALRLFEARSARRPRKRE